MSRPHYIIHEETNYDKFVLQDNRPTYQSHVDELAQSMEESGFYYEYPIVCEVGPKGRLIVRDGQHRFLAAKQTDTAIYYVISNRIRSADVPRLQGMVKGWALRDYMAIYIDQGLPHYAKIKELHEQYPKCTLNSVISLCMTGNVGMSNESRVKFELGTITIDHYDWAVTILQLAEKFERFIPTRYMHRSFLGALIRVMRHSKFDLDRFLKKMSAASQYIEPRVSVDDFVTLLQNMYNHNLRGGDKPVSLMFDE